jgi:hypothetical protein
MFAALGFVVSVALFSGCATLMDDPDSLPTTTTYPEPCAAADYPCVTIPTIPRCDPYADDCYSPAPCNQGLVDCAPAPVEPLAKPGASAASTDEDRQIFDSYGATVPEVGTAIAGTLVVTGPGTEWTLQDDSTDELTRIQVLYDTPIFTYDGQIWPSAVATNSGAVIWCGQLLESYPPICSSPTILLY